MNWGPRFRHGHICATIGFVDLTPHPITSGPSAAPAVLDERLERYDRRLLVEGSLQDRLRVAGFVMLEEPVLGPAELAALHAIAEELLDRIDEPAGDTFLTAGRIQDPSLRSDVSRRTAAIVLPKLQPLFVEEAEVRGSALQIKPPSPSSELNCHQDSSLVDERTQLGVYVWVAIDDTSERNGGLCVLPGSHRFGNLQRTLNVPWQLARFGDEMARRSVALTVPAGGAVLFDAATVHSSPPNRSNRMRLATNAFACHSDSALLHFYQDENTTPGCVEVFEVDLSFFRDDDIMARPGPRHRRLGEWPQHRIEWSDDEFARLCAQAIEEAR